jgi:hypothetical protein
MVQEESPAPLVETASGPEEEEDPKRRKRDAKLLAECARALDPWERYRALVDALEEAMDSRAGGLRAGFALVIMGRSTSPLLPSHAPRS